MSPAALRFVNVKNNLDQNLVHIVASKSETGSGWTVGGGIETVLVQNWTAKTEYLYIDAGGQDVFNPVFPALTASPTSTIASTSSGWA